MGAEFTDRRLYASARRLAWAAAKRWFTLVPGVVFGLVDVFERLTGLAFSPPPALYIGLIGAGMLAAVLWGYHDLRLVEVREYDEIKRQRDEAERRLAEGTDPRETVHVSPETLTGFYRERTSVQAAKLVEPYLDGWMKLSGPLDDVAHRGDGQSVVSFAAGTFNDSANVYLVFPDDEGVQKRLSQLTRGDEITVLGQVDEVTAYNVFLKNCELLRVR